MTLREAGPIEEGDLRNPTGESPAQVLSEDSDTCNQPQVLRSFAVSPPTELAWRRAAVLTI